MKGFVKSYLPTLLFFGIVGLIGGFCTGLYLLDSYPENIRAELLSELAALGLPESIPTEIVTGLLSAISAAGYGIVLGDIGLLIAKRLYLVSEDRSITAGPLLFSILVALIGGLVMIYADQLFFGRYSEAIMDFYLTKPTLVYLIGCVSYGAVIEEVMLRLFMMSLIAFILHKVSGGGKEAPKAWMLVCANIISALIFAAAHLPATFMILGSSPILIARCFIMNGGIGLMFGWLYRKFGLRYAMIAHGGCHVVSKLIWMLLI